MPNNGSGYGTNFGSPAGGTVQYDLTNESGLALLVHGTGAAPTTANVFSIGCLYVRTDGSGASVYQNVGTAASPSWSLMDTASTSLQLPEAATDASTTTTNSLDLTMSGLTSGNGLLITAANATSGGVINVTSPSSNALVVGRQGKTSPALQVDASAATSVTGIKITSAASGSGAAIATISSATDDGLVINAKGSGTIGIGSVSTGAVTITPATTITGLATLTGGLTSAANAILKSGTAAPATAGAVAAGAPISLYSGLVTIEVTTDAPTHVRPKGSLCVATNGSSATTRLFINTDGSTGWTSITTAT